MTEVTIRELRNHGGEVVDRVARGEHFVVTRDGEPVAELRPLRRRPASSEVLLRRWSRLPVIDAVALRADIDAVIDNSL